VRKAVDLASAPAKERERYGRNLFGQSVMLGRRLLDAGVRLVQCNWQRTQGVNGFAWDTHWNNFTAHKDDLVPPFDRALDGEAAADVLTARQREVLRLVAGGKSTKEIAYALNLSVKTVETHRAQIMERLNIRDVAGLVRYALRTGLVPPD